MGVVLLVTEGPHQNLLISLVHSLHRHQFHRGQGRILHPIIRTGDRYLDIGSIGAV